MVSADSGALLSYLLQFVETKDNRRKSLKDGSHQNIAQVTLARLQDRDLQEMKDDGYCLSMHQPWASLLVAGIKK